MTSEQIHNQEQEWHSKTVQIFVQVRINPFVQDALPFLICLKGIGQEMYNMG